MKRKRAIFTQIHNEPDFFPVWLRYYSQFYGSQDIYVIHLLKPNRVDFDDWMGSQSGFVRLPTLDKDYCDFQLVVDRAQHLQRALLDQYECVLFAEVDEFVAHESGLGNFIDRWLASGRSQAETCNGYEVVHHPESEPAIDLSRPLLPQRRWWYHGHLYDKTILSKVPLRWCHGFHNCAEFPWQTTDPNLLLIHLHKLDYDLCVRRKVERLRNESDAHKVAGHPIGSPGWHHFISNYEMRAWFALNIDDGTPAIHSEIPEHIKNILI